MPPSAPPSANSRASTIGRAAWAIGDQALSSLTNFGLAIGVAHQVGTTDFGAFSIAFAAFLVALSVSRAISTDPLMIRYSSRPIDEWRTGTARATGLALDVGVGAGILFIVTGWLLGGSLGTSLVVLGVGMPALLVQDAWRFAFFATRRGRAAFANDLVWTVVLAVAFVVIIVTGQHAVGMFVGAWVLGALVAALYGIAQSGVTPDPRRGPDWWREHHDIAPRLATEAAILSGAQPVTLAAMSAVAGLATVGTIRAGQALMNAIHIATYGIQLFGVPEAVRMLERSTQALVGFCVILATGLVGVALAWGTVLLLLPDDIGRALLGANWEPAQTVLLPTVVLSMAGGAQGGALVGLRSLAAASRSLRARIVSSLLISTGGLVGVAVGGAVTGAWGMAIGLWIGSVFWWWQFLRAVEARRRLARATGGHGAIGEAVPSAGAVAVD